MCDSSDLAGRATQIIAAATALDGELHTAFQDWAAAANPIYLGTGYFDSRRTVLPTNAYTLNLVLSTPVALSYRAVDKDGDLVWADLPIAYLTDPVAWEALARSEYADETARREKAHAMRCSQFGELAVVFERSAR